MKPGFPSSAYSLYRHALAILSKKIFKKSWTQPLLSTFTATALVQGTTSSQLDLSLVFLLPLLLLLPILSLKKWPECASKTQTFQKFPLRRTEAEVFTRVYAAPPTSPTSCPASLPSAVTRWSHHTYQGSSHPRIFVQVFSLLGDSSLRSSNGTSSESLSWLPLPITLSPQPAHFPLQHFLLSENISYGFMSVCLEQTDDYLVPWAPKLVPGTQ